MIALLCALAAPTLASADGGLDADTPSFVDAASVDATQEDTDATASERVDQDASILATAREDASTMDGSDARGNGAAPLASGALDAGHDADASAGVAHGARTSVARAGRLSLGEVARIAIGLCVLLALVLMAGHRQVSQFEQRFGLSMLASTGVPFLAIGALCAHPAVGVLTPSVLMDLRPALEFGLGWIGLRIGSEFDVREFDRLPAGTTRLLGAETGLAFVLAGGTTAVALAAFGGSPASVLIRDATLLGACAAVSAPTGARLLEARGLMHSSEAKMLRRVTRLDDALALLALAVVNAVFHPNNGAAARAHLPALGWVFVQIGMGATLGFALYAFRATATKPIEKNALTFGVVAFASGMAGYLGFSPIVVAFVAGVVVTNVTRGVGLGAFGEQLVGLERPIFVMFFSIVGATWSLGSERAWIVIPLFVLMRLLGKNLGVRLSFAADSILHRREGRLPIPSADAAPSAGALSSNDGRDGEPLLEVSDPRLAVVALTPSSVVAVAITISARAQYSDLAPFVLTVVIVSGVFAELITQLEAARAAQRRSAAEKKEQR
ncbi:MAG: cation:proton antiporter [Polyangiales bacterium]